MDGALHRDLVIEYKGLVDALIVEACEGPVHTDEGIPDQSDPWPLKYAEVDRREAELTIVTWAVAGALNNPALSPDGREIAMPSGICMCMQSTSPDQLEAKNGKWALLHLGLEESCHFWNCVDDISWFHEGEGGVIEMCQDYTHEEYCEEYGDSENEDGTMVAD